MRTVILLECSVPPELNRAEALGAISGVLAQHGALGVHETALGDITVSLAAAANVERLDDIDTIHALLFDSRRTPELVTKHKISVAAAVRAGAELADRIFEALPSMPAGGAA